jgi:hypothetical protein
MRFEVLTAVKMQKVVLWVVTSAPKMEAVFSSK